MSSTSVILTFGATALGLAALLSAIVWGVELVLGRRIGLYLSYAMLLFVVLFTAYGAYGDLKFCALAERPTLQDCEWSVLLRLFFFCLTLLTIPSLVLSAIILKKWTNTRMQH